MFLVFHQSAPAVSFSHLNEEDSEWLSQEIKDNNSHKKALLILSLVYFTSGLVIFLSYTKFLYANKKVVEYKASNKNHS